MAQAVATKSINPPSRITTEGDRMLGLLTNKLDREGVGFSIAAEDAPSRDLVERMTSRAMYLDDRLGPMGETEAFKHYAILKNVLKARKRSDGEAEMATETYVHVLAPLPAFAVIQACEEALSGIIGDREWIPEPPVLAGRAREIAQAWVAERRRIRDVLSAKVRAPRASAEKRKAAAQAARHGLQPIPYGSEKPKRGGMSQAEIDEAHRMASSIGQFQAPDCFADLTPEQFEAIPNAPVKEGQHG